MGEGVSLISYIDPPFPRVTQVYRSGAAGGGESMASRRARPPRRQKRRPICRISSGATGEITVLTYLTLRFISLSSCVSHMCGYEFCILLCLV